MMGVGGGGGGVVWRYEGIDLDCWDCVGESVRDEW